MSGAAEARGVVARYLEALSRRDEAGARACASEEGWAARHDGPGDLLRQAQTRGIRVDHPGDVIAGDRGRAACWARVYDSAGLARGRVALLLGGAPPLIEGVSNSDTLVARYLEGVVGPRLRLEALDESPALTAAATALGETVNAAAAGDASAIAQADALLNRSRGDLLVVGYLLSRCSAGARLVIQRCAALPSLRRGVVQATLRDEAGAEEEIWLYAELGDAPRLRGHGPYFSPQTLLAFDGPAPWEGPS